MTITDELTKFPEAPGARLPREIVMTPAESLISTARYTSRAVFDDEVAKLWSRVWQLACRVDEVGGPGAFTEYTVADQSFLVVRGDDGRVRAFHNVCRHRGNQLKCGAGSARELRCSFHRWAWTLEGKIKDVPDIDSFEAVDVSQYGLFEVPSGIWSGFVFINPSAEAAAELPLEEFLEPVNEHLAGYHFEQMVAFSDVTTPLAANWKVTVAAFLEAYHVQGVHPQILPSNDDVNTCYEVMGLHSRMLTRFAVPSPRLGPDVEPFEVIAYLPNALGGPMGHGVSMDYEKSRLRKVVDSITTDSGELELPPGTTIGDVVAQLLEPFVDEKGALQLAEGVGSREVLVEMIAAFVEDGDTLRLPRGVSARDLYLEMLIAVGHAKGHDYSELSRDQVLDDWHYFIFPNVVLNIQGGAFLFIRVRPDRHDHEVSLFDVQRFVWPMDSERAAIRPSGNRLVDHAEFSFGPVLDQDIETIPKLQRGLHSSALKYITVGQQETRIVSFHEKIDEYLAR